EPGRGRWRVPAAHARLDLELHRCAVRRVALQRLLDCVASGLAIYARRQPERQLERGKGTQHVAGVLQRRDALGASDGKRRAPVAVEKQLVWIVTDRACAAREGQLRVNAFAERLRGGARLLQSILGNLAPQSIDQLAGLRV